MKKRFEYFYDAWWFLHDHPMFLDKSLDKGQKGGFYLWSSRFSDCLDIDVQKVNPKKRAIDDNRTLNTETEIWLECGPWWYEDGKDSLGNPIPEWKPRWVPSHDPNLDCGGINFEGAIIKLANLVYKHYGNKQVVYDKGIQIDYSEKDKYD
jgi:hypothetical protein